MQVHHGIYNDQYHLAPAGEDSPLNIDMAGTTRPNENFRITCTAPPSLTLSFYQLEYVLDGKLFIDAENKTYTAEKGDFYFINRAVPRILYTDKKNPVQKLYVTAKGELMNGIVKAYKFEDPVIIVRTDVEKYFRNIIRILDEAPRYTSVERDKIGVEILQIVQAVHAELNLPGAAVDKRKIPENIMNYIDSNINRKFTIEELCQNFYLRKTQLIKVFKEKYGITPIRYAQIQRIELAKYYLSTTDIPISDLHEVIGFDDIKYFSKLFKKETGISPREYRQTKRKIVSDAYDRKFERFLRKFK